MTRRLVYLTAMVAFLAATALTLASILVPQWISWDETTSAGTVIHQSYGLHQICSSLDGACRKFPKKSECGSSNRYFCSMWRSVGFLMSFSIVLEGLTAVAFIVIFGGGKQRRENSWKILCFLLILVATAECAGMSIVAYLYDHDDRFFQGWQLSTSWIMCTISWSILASSAAIIVVSAWLLPPEGGYELIPDRYD